MKEKISEKDAARGYVQNAVFLSSLFWREIKDLVFECGADQGISLRNLDGEARPNILLALVGQNLSVIRDFEPIFQEASTGRSLPGDAPPEVQTPKDNLGGFQRTIRMEYWCFKELASFCGSNAESGIGPKAELVNRYRQVQVESINCRQNPFENITGDLLCRLFGENFPGISESLKGNLERSFVTRATEIFTNCSARAFQFWKELGGAFDFYESPIPMELAVPSQVGFGVASNLQLGQAKPLESPRLPESCESGISVPEPAVILSSKKIEEKEASPELSGTQGFQKTVTPAPTASRKVRCRGKDHDFNFSTRLSECEPSTRISNLKNSIAMPEICLDESFSEEESLEFTSIVERGCLTPVVESEKKLFVQLSRRAENGDREAQFELGNRFYKGNGVPKDLLKAREWFLRSGKKGHSDSQVRLGYIAFKGKNGIRKNYSEAFSWFSKPASKGHPVAQRYLGIMFLQGKGKPVALPKARKWFQQSAEKGDVISQRNLGVMLFHGQGGGKNAVEAFSWFRKAALKGDRLACRNLGIMYFNGHGTRRDSSRAKKWFLHAIRRGDKDSHFDLGLLFLEDGSYGKNLLAARKCLRIFADNSKDSAAKRKALEILKSTRRNLPMPSMKGFWIPRFLGAGIFLLGTLIIFERLYLLLI